MTMHEIVRERAHWGRITLLEPVASYPNIRQTPKLFLLEFRFSPHEETRSVSIPMTLAVSGFGEIISLQFQRPADLAELRPSIDTLLKTADFKFVEKDSSVTFALVDDIPKRTRDVTGFLMLTMKGELAAVGAWLRA